jgi:hypothetical protein
MSTHTYLRATAIAALTTVAFAATAASANAQNSRYGNIYDYESGHNCGQACVGPLVAQPVRAPAYVPPQAVTGPPIYVDCSTMGSCASQQATTVYTEPQTYSNSYSASTTYSSGTLNCPAGTTAQADGTCLQDSSYSSMSTTTYTGPTTTYSGTMTHSSPVTCPYGTTEQADGTCLEVYQGDAQTSYGYQSTGVTTDYRPIRK